MLLGQFRFGREHLALELAGNDGAADAFEKSVGEISAKRGFGLVDNELRCACH